MVRRTSSGLVALGAPVGFPNAPVPFPTLGACAPGFTGWPRGARGGRPRNGIIVSAAGPCRGRGAGLAPRRIRSGPRDRVVPGGSLRRRSWAACAAVVGVLTWSLTRPVSRTVRRSTGDSAGAPGLFHVDANTSPCGSEDATPVFPACVRLLVAPRPVGRAGLAGAFSCASPFLWPLYLSALPGPLRTEVGPLLFLCLPSFFSLFFLLRPSFRAPQLSPAFSVSGLGCPRPWRCVFFLSPPPFLSFFLFCAPSLSLALFGFRPRALALCVVCFPDLPRLGSPYALAAFVFPARPLAAPLWLLPPPLFVSRSFCRCRLPLLCCLTPACLLGARQRFLPSAPPPSSRLFCWSPTARLSVCSHCFCVSCLAVGCSPVGAAPPPPFYVSWSSSVPLASLFFVLPCCFAPACLFGARRRISPSAAPPRPPSPGARVVPCAVWCCRAVLPFGRVFCGAVLPCSVLPVMLCRVSGRSVRLSCSRCVLLSGFGLRCRVLCRGGVSVIVLSRAVRCCCVLCRVSGRSVRLSCSRCGLLSGFGLRCRVLCCAVCPWVRCCAGLLRVVPLGVALWRCLLPRGAVLGAAVYCGIPPRCVFCAVRVLSWCIGVCCCSQLYFVLCVSWGVVQCIPCPLRSARCCAELCRFACNVLFV